MSSENIGILIRNAREGDVASFGEVYEIYSKDLYKFAYYYTGSSVVAEDCVSEAVLLAFQKITSLKNADAFRSWMFKILRNCCYKALNDKKKNLNNVDYSSLHNIRSEDEDLNAEISLVNALALLDPAEREIIVLHYSSGYSSKEIGKILGMKDSTVRSKMSRATDKLRQILCR